MGKFFIHIHTPLSPMCELVISTINLEEVLSQRPDKRDGTVPGRGGPIDLPDHNIYLGIILTDVKKSNKVSKARSSS